MLRSSYIRYGRWSDRDLRPLFNGIEHTDSEDNEHTVEKDERFKASWAATFGIGSPVQVFFPDQQLNARIYTLDGDSGYKVTAKKVSLGQIGSKPDDQCFDGNINIERLAYPRMARRGEKHGKAKITAETVVKIRQWAAEIVASGLKPPWTQKSKELGISEGALRDIVHRRTWIHIP